jgi:1-pyrroline-5-carboxylate dehydrogenase
VFNILIASDKTGYFIDPTILVTTDPKAPTMVNELFGPVVTIYVYPADKYEETVSVHVFLRYCVVSHVI